MSSNSSDGIKPKIWAGIIHFSKIKRTKRIHKQSQVHHKRNRNGVSVSDRRISCTFGIGDVTTSSVNSVMLLPLLRLYAIRIVIRKYSHLRPNMVCQKYCWCSNCMFDNQQLLLNCKLQRSRSDRSGLTVEGRIEYLVVLSIWFAVPLQAQNCCRTCGHHRFKETVISSQVPQKRTSIGVVVSDRRISSTSGIPYKSQ